MSNLLPKHHEEFRKKEYWDQFFTTRDKESFEWYGEYKDLRPTLAKLEITPAQRILVVGCGNSKLSAEWYVDGYENIVNIDFSELVINEMKTKHADLNHMQWQVMDMTDLEFEDDSFDIVLDKGALDALMADDTEEIKRDASKMFAEISRVLTPNGTYICVTMAQQFILNHLLQTFCAELKWNISADEVARTPTKALGPFVINCTRPETEQQKNTVHFIGTMSSIRSAEENTQWLTNEIQASQWYSLTKQRVKTIKVGRVMEPIELFSSEAPTTTSDPIARYTIRLVDSYARGNNGPCGVFLIPQGREHEWMFSEEEGLRQLGQGAGFSRLIVVALGRQHKFESTTAVQEELSPKVMELVPEESLKSDAKIPYLSIAEGLGERNTVYNGKSEFSGEFIVEEVPSLETPGNVLRRLVFRDNMAVIQSEVEMIPNVLSASAKRRLKKKNKANPSKQITLKKHRVNHEQLSFAYHRGIVATVMGLSQASDASSTLVVGLGGGALPMYLHNAFQSMNIVACELDEAIVKVAKECFGFVEDSRLKVKVADGLKYLAGLAAGKNKHFDSIIVDVDSKDNSVGMSCPPVAFVEQSFLKNVHSCLNDGGLLVVNMSCRNPSMYQKAIAELHKVFSNGDILELKASEEDVNRIVCCLKNQKLEQKPSMLAQKVKRQVREGDPFELVDLVKEMRLVEKSVQ